MKLKISLSKSTTTNAERWANSTISDWPAKILILKLAKWSNNTKDIFGECKMRCLSAMACFQLTQNTCSRFLMLKNLSCCFLLILMVGMVLIIDFCRMILPKINWMKTYQKQTNTEIKVHHLYQNQKKSKSFKLMPSNYKQLPP